MIARLRGVVDSCGEDWLVLDVNGVGYLLLCSARTLRAVGASGEPATLLTELHVREDALTLYGFIDGAERDWFRLLCTVQGVGAKVALGLLSALPPQTLGTAIVSGDRTALTRAPGVGPKLAGRLTSELKDKALKLGALEMTGRKAAAAAADTDATEAGPGPVSDRAADALSALENLGYGRADAFEAVARATADLGPDAEASALIHAALKAIGRKA